MSAEPANRDEEILQQLQSPAFLIDLRQQMLKFAILQLSSFQLAEDAVQEALASAYQHIDSFTGRQLLKHGCLLF
jgi:RNA polymerase sigma-70 factor (ECF subfamily)